MDISSTIQLIVLVILLALSAFFSSSETALLNRGLTSDMLHIGLTLVMCMGAGMIGGMVS